MTLTRDIPSQSPSRTRPGTLRGWLAAFGLLVLPVAAFGWDVPAGFVPITGEFIRLEELFEKGKWKEAQEQVDRIEGQFGEMALDLERAVGIAGMDEMGFAIEGMRGALSSKDLRKAEEGLSSLHNAYLSLAERYRFPSLPPAVILTQAAFSEAMAALEARDIKRVHLKMEELDWLLPWFEQDLQQKQASFDDMRALHRKVTSARRAAAAGDEAVLKPDLEEANARAKLFYPLFKDQTISK